MGRTEFLMELARRLDALPREEINKSLSFYAEMIDDRMEDGMSEAQAVQSMEDMDTIVQRIMGEAVPAAEAAPPAPAAVRPRRGGLSIALIVLGFPVWFPLLAAGFAVALAVYAVIWSLVAALYAMVLGLAVSGAAAVLASLIKLILWQVPSGLFFAGSGLIVLGLGVLLFKPVNRLALGMIHASARFGRWLAARFARPKKGVA